MPSKQKETIQLLKNNESLFSRLYLVHQSGRSGNIKDFFKHENQAYPPSISSCGQIRLSSNKSDILDCLKWHAQPTNIKPLTDVTVFDGGSLIHKLKPIKCRTFADYAVRFKDYIEKELNSALRIDIVWDRYPELSLKTFCRQTRIKNHRTVSRRRVMPSIHIPKNWKNFLGNPENKIELHELLSDATSCIPTQKEIVITQKENVYISTQRDDTQMLSPCNHEEADTRIFVHINDGIHYGYYKFLIVTVDSDIVCIAVSFIAQMHQVEDLEIWIAFGTGNNFRYIPTHEIVKSIGPYRARYLPLLQAFLGVDTTSSMYGIGRKTALAIEKTFLPIQNVFYDLVQNPNSLSDDQFSVIERYVILMYDRLSKLTEINDLREYLFTKKGRQMLNLPPTQDALRHHLNRAIFQGAVDWGNCSQPMRNMPSPSLFSWVLDGKHWKPKWTGIQQASTALQQLSKCSCNTGKCKSCTCANLHLTCTIMCKCGGECGNIFQQ